jgi:hypothetical protein
MPHAPQRQGASSHHIYERVKRSIAVTEEEHHELAHISIVDSSPGRLGLPEFAGSAICDSADDPDDPDDHHDYYGREFNSYVEVRDEEAAEATEARRESGKGSGEGSQARSGRSQEPFGRQEAAE